MIATVQTFAYDRFGNRGLDVENTSDNVKPANGALQLGDFSGANNRIIRAEHFYDSAGNLTAAPLKTFTFDAEGRIVMASVAGGASSQYLYDGNGRRVKKVVGGVAARFEYGAGGELIAERNESTGAVTKDYFYKGGALLATTKTGTNGEYQYATADHLGSPRAWTDDSGNLVAGGRHDYMPFGEDLVAGVGIRSASNGYDGDSARQQFTGQEEDAETGLYYFKARYFSSAQGRFTGVDPMNFGVAVINPQNWNRYVYALNNPVVVVDRNGKFPTAIHDLITEMAFPGLKAWEIKRIERGNKHTDFRDGWIPVTLMEKYANEHSMALPGQPAADAKAGADRYIAEMDKKAQQSPLERFYFFGRGDHTLQDGVSPKHARWQQFEGLHLTGIFPLDLILTYRWVRGVRVHAAGEDGITGEQLNEAIRLSREHFKRLFPKDYKRAISGKPQFTFSPTAWIEVKNDLVAVTDMKLGNDFVIVGCEGPRSKCAIP